MNKIKKSNYILSNNELSKNINHESYDNNIANLILEVNNEIYKEKYGEEMHKKYALKNYKDFLNEI